MTATTIRPRITADLCPTLHRDGTVSYWSVTQQVWERRTQVSDADLAAMSPAERTRITAR